MFLESNMDYYKNKSPSPTENENDSASSSDDEGDKIRVGKDYQAVVPDLIPESERNHEEYLDKALLVWSPNYKISDQKVDDYINLAKDKYGYNGEQALGMLFWHDHNLERAINDLANFIPFPDEWSLEDKALFEQAFQFHGKNFHRIRQMLPEKSIAALVKYYYSWKKTKSRTSLMDRQARKLAISRSSNLTEEGPPTSDHGSEGGSNTDSDSDDKKDSSNGGPKQTNSCVNCGVLCNEVQTTSKGCMCRTCALHFRKTGNSRPTIGPIRGRADRHYNLPRNKRTPPRGMYINHDDLTAIASGTAAQTDNLLKSMDRELLTLKRIVQNNKQSISSAKRKTADSVAQYKIEATASPPITAHWTNEEAMLAIQGIRNFGKDFQAIADIIGTKTKNHVKTFYVSNRRRYSLDLLCQDHERREDGVAVDGSDSTDNGKLDKMDADALSSDSDGLPASNSSSPSSPLAGLNNNNNASKAAQTVVAAK